MAVARWEADSACREPMGFDCKPAHFQTAMNSGMLGAPVKNSFAVRFFADQDIEAAGSLAREAGVEAFGLQQQAGRGTSILHGGEQIEAIAGGFQCVELEPDDEVLKGLG